MSGKIINAVRVRYQGGRVWCVNSGSISTYGRREAVLNCEATTKADAIEVGNDYLARRGTAMTSFDIDLARTPQFELGDTITIPGIGAQRVTGTSGRLDPQTGLWAPEKPELVSARTQWLLDADREFEKMLARRGYGSPSAGVDPSKNPAPSGKMADVQTLSWSWYAKDGEDDGELEDDGWQVELIDEACRASLIAVIPDYKHSTGITTLELLRKPKGGSWAVWNPLWNFNIPATASSLFDGSLMHWMYGYSFLFPGDQLRVRCTAYGKHHQGVLKLLLTTPS